MLLIPSLNLCKTTTDHLAKQQKLINDEVTYEQEIKKANSLWNGKKGSLPGKAAFEEIIDQLADTCIGKKYCHYCEHARIRNEKSVPDSDIEHFYPKTHFPDKAFKAANFLYSCKDCNSSSKGKGAKFQVFDPSGNVITLRSGKGRAFSLPASTDSVLVNPKVENPMDILFLELSTGLFVLHPNHNSTSREKTRFDYTVKEVLHLNAYAVDRRESYQTFVTCLRNYIQAKFANSIELLLDLKDNTQSIIFRSFSSDNLETCRTSVLEDIRLSIPLRKHQTVWKEMQRQRTTIPNLQALFTQAPEALNW